MGRGDGGLACVEGEERRGGRKSVNFIGPSSSPLPLSLRCLPTSPSIVGFGTGERAAWRGSLVRTIVVDLTSSISQTEKIEIPLVLTYFSFDLFFEEVVFHTLVL